MAVGVGTTLGLMIFSGTGGGPVWHIIRSVIEGENALVFGTYREVSALRIGISIAGFFIGENWVLVMSIFVLLKISGNFSCLKRGSIVLNSAAKGGPSRSRMRAAMSMSWKDPR